MRVDLFKYPSAALAGLLMLWIGQARASESGTFQFDWQPPGFTAETASGSSFSYPADLQGRPTIILFWATWCPFCKSLMPHLQSVVDEYGDQVQVLAPNFREDGDPVEFLQRYGYEFTLFPNADEVADSWGIKGTPGLFLADGSGRVVFSRGAIPKAAYPEERFGDTEGMKRFQIAARTGPFWAARLRLSLDQLIALGEPKQDE